MIIYLRKKLFLSLAIFLLPVSSVRPQSVISQLSRRKAELVIAAYCLYRAYSWYASICKKESIALRSRIYYHNPKRYPIAQDINVDYLCEEQRYKLRVTNMDWCSSDSMYVSALTLPLGARYSNASVGYVEERYLISIGLDNVQSHEQVLTVKIIDRVSNIEEVHTIKLDSYNPDCSLDRINEIFARLNYEADEHILKLYSRFP